MGGHGGLNILPQKRWNVYNFDNREKVRQDEEAAAKDEQIKRDQSRKRDTELRLIKLRQLRGLSTSQPQSEPQSGPEPKSEPEPVPEADSDREDVDVAKRESGHMNLFAGIKIFDPKQGGIDIEAKSGGKREVKIDRKDDRDGKRMRKEKKEEVKVITAEDEKYRLGYGLVGKGSKLPWYLAKPQPGGKEVENGGDGEREVVRKSSGKKSLQELREERLKRERKEKEREMALFVDKSRRDRGFASRR